MKIEVTQQNTDMIPILPQSIKDFQGKSILEMRDYLLSKHVRQLFVIGEIRSLLDLSYLDDSLAKGVIEACFKKVEKTPLPKWEKLLAGK